MEDAERFRLLGTYRTPRFRIGQRVRCQVRGEMVITGMTDAPIPWPVGRREPGRASLIVYKGLAKAIHRESNRAICHWWGISPKTVTILRKQLSVEPYTEGTVRLLRGYMGEYGGALLERSIRGARDPERRRKLSEALRGRAPARHVIEAARRANLGSHPSEEARRRMSETHRRRGTLVPGTVPWTAKEDELARTLPAEEAARRTGRSLNAVYARLGRLKVPDGRQQRG